MFYFNNIQQTKQTQRNPLIPLCGMKDGDRQFCHYVHYSWYLTEDDKISIGYHAKDLTCLKYSDCNLNPTQNMLLSVEQMQH